MSAAASTIATPAFAAELSRPITNGARLPRPSGQPHTLASRREAVGLFPTVAAAALAIAALRRDGFDADEIGLLAAAEAAASAARIAPGGIAASPALGAFFVASTMRQAAGDEAARLDGGNEMLLGSGLAYWLLRHAAALPSGRLRDGSLLLTVFIRNEGREADALASLRHHGAACVRVHEID